MAGVPEVAFDIVLSSGARYRFDPTRRLLRGDAAPIRLTKLEAKLFAIVASGVGVRRYDEIERHLWPDPYIEDPKNRMQKALSVLKRKLPSRVATAIRAVQGVGYEFDGATVIVPDLRVLVVPLLRPGLDQSVEGFLFTFARLIATELQRKGCESCDVDYAVEAYAREFPRPGMDIRSSLDTFVGRLGYDTWLGLEYLPAGGVVAVRLRVRGEQRCILDREFTLAQAHAANIRSLADDTAREIAQRLDPASPEGGGSVTGTQASSNPRAMELYYRAIAHWRRRAPSDLVTAIALLEQSIELDDRNALAHAGLALALSMNLHGSQFAPSTETMPRARQAAERAIALDPDNGEAHAVLGVYHFAFRWDETSARRAFERAIGCNANSATIHQWFASMLAEAGHASDALEHAELAVRLNAEDAPMVLATRSRVLAFAGRFDEAVAAARAAVDRHPTFPKALVFLGIALSLSGRQDDAVSYLEEAATASRRQVPAVLSELGWALGRAGRRGEAEAVLGELDRLQDTTFVSSFVRGRVWCSIREHRRALACFKMAFEERASWMPTLATDPGLEEFRRASPGCEQLIARIGPKRSRRLR